MIKYISLFCLFMGLGFISFAQPDRAHQEKIESMRMQYITNRIDLQPAEAQNFWPVYNEYRSKLEHTKAQRIDRLIESKKMSCTDIDQMTQKEAQELLQSQFNREQEFIDIREHYFKKFGEILSAQKVAKLYKAELDFHKRLIDRLSK